jgi:hypothetical protein
MATYVNDLRLKEIGTGESSGTWGTETNVNLELIGEAFGYATKALADASTGTLTIPDGTATDGEPRALYLKLTGGGQTQTVTLAPNTASKTWIIDNGTAYALTFSQGSGANVAIAAGQTKVITTDGAGSGAVVYDCFTDLELAGAITAATSFTAPLIEGSTSVQTPLIEYTDGDDAITIADGGGVTMASGITSTAAANSFGASSFGDANITNVGDVQLDSITGDGDTDTSITFSGSNVITVKADDAGAAIGPILTLYRNSTSPADADRIGGIYFSGEDSGGAETIYTSLESTIDDVTNGTEDGTLCLRTMTAGTLTTQIDISSVAISIQPNTTVAGTLAVTGAQTFTGVTTHGGNVVSDADSTDDLGTTSVRWANAFIDDITLTTTITAGTSGVFGDMSIANGSITSSSGAITFGNENLVTTGTLGAGATTVGTLSASTGAFSDSVTITKAGLGSTIVQTTDSDTAQTSLKLRRYRSGGDLSDGTGCNLDFEWEDNAAGPFIYARISGVQDADDNDGALVFSSLRNASLTAAMRVDSSGNVLVGKSAVSGTTEGQTFYANGYTELVRENDVALAINRETGDGTLIAFYQDDSLEGTISVSGSTVSYNGAHLSFLSQLPIASANRRDNTIKRGTVMEYVGDEMCEWHYEDWEEEEELKNGKVIKHKKRLVVDGINGGTGKGIVTKKVNDQRMRSCVSKNKATKKVCGLFENWDDDNAYDNSTGDKNTWDYDYKVVTSGDFVVRVTGPCEAGDLLMSNGDGTAIVQADDIIRSSTIAKVAKNVKGSPGVENSDLVPCQVLN